MNTKKLRFSCNYCFWCSFGEIKIDFTLKKSNILDGIYSFIRKMKVAIKIFEFRSIKLRPLYFRVELSSNLYIGTLKIRSVTVFFYNAVMSKRFRWNEMQCRPRSDGSCRSDCSWQRRPRSNCSSRSSLIRVYTVFSDLSGPIRKILR